MHVSKKLIPKNVYKIVIYHLDDQMMVQTVHLQDNS